MIRALVVLAMLAPARSAHAWAGCLGEQGWSPAVGSTVAPRAHVMFYSSHPGATLTGKPTATIDGKPVAVKWSYPRSAPYWFFVVDIDSDRTGALVLRWQGGTYRFSVAQPPVVRDASHATTSRYHPVSDPAIATDVFDGLAIALDAPAVLAHVKLRRDAKAPWIELDAPVIASTIRIGKLGCAGENYSPELLERGVDVDVTLTYDDGRTSHLDDLAHVTLPKR